MNVSISTPRPTKNEKGVIAYVDLIVTAPVHISHCEVIASKNGPFVRFPHLYNSTTKKSVEYIRISDIATYRELQSKIQEVMA